MFEFCRAISSMTVSYNYNFFASLLVVYLHAVSLVGISSGDHVMVGNVSQMLHTWDTRLH
jgi:hypothetical protein